MTAARHDIHALMVRFADGDRAAFRPLFDQLWPTLLAITTRGLQDRADAEDAAQRALLVVFRRIVDLDRGRDGVAWAATIAAFEVMTIRRSRQRRREAAITGDELIAITDVGPRPDEHLARSELRAAVREVVGELPERDRDALAAVLSDQPPPPGETPRKRRFRAMERLRAAWRKVHG